MWRILTGIEQRWIRGKQPWAALKQLCFRENQRWNRSDSALIFCCESFQLQSCSRENQRCSALNQLCFGENQRWFSTDFELWNLGFLALFKAESALFIDFQVLNSAETDLKFFWIRADQCWMSLRRQPGIVWLHASQKLDHGIAIEWTSMRKFCQMMITYSSEQKFDLKCTYKYITLKYEAQNFPQYYDWRY